MTQELQAELLFGPTATFGEGPLWDDRTGLLWWTDIPAATIHVYEPSSGADTAFEVGTHVGALVPRASGGLMAATRDGFAGISYAGEVELLVPVNADDPSMRMNDGKCDAAGRFYASTMTFTGEPRVGELLRLDADGTVHSQASGLAIGNGLAWTADQRTMYFTDTMDRRIDVFDADPVTGDLTNRRTAFEVDGLADGFCIDDEGALWVAIWRGGQVRRYSPDGDLLAVVHVPVSNVTCPSFGGPAYDQLFITTAAPSFAGLQTDEPLGGAVFVVRPGVTGPPPAAFAG